MKTLPSLSVHADDYMFAPLDECRVIPKGEKEISRGSMIRVYESGNKRRYVYQWGLYLVGCFLVTVIDGKAIISLIKVRDDFKRNHIGTELYRAICWDFEDVDLWCTSPASEAFAKSVTKL